MGEGSFGGSPISGPSQHQEGQGVKHQLRAWDGSVSPLPEDECWGARGGGCLGRGSCCHKQEESAEGE